MKYFIIVLLLLVFGCGENKTTNIVEDNILIYRINPYNEKKKCSRIAVENYGFIIKGRFKIFDKELNTDFEKKIDTVCVIGYTNEQRNKKVFIEHWKFTNNNEAKNYYLKLNNLKNDINFKAPQFWKWDLKNNYIIFYYSMNTKTQDSFFQNVIKVYRTLKTRNCCQHSI